MREKPQQPEKVAELGQHEEIRKSETYKRLRAHGIGDSISVMWILKDPERATAAVDLAEKKDQEKALRSTAGYIRTLVEGDSIIGTTEYEASKQKRRRRAGEDQSGLGQDGKKQRDELERAAALERFLSLEDDERETIVSAYLAETSDFNRIEFEKKKTKSLFFQIHLKTLFINKN